MFDAPAQLEKGQSGATSGDGKGGGKSEIAGSFLAKSSSLLRRVRILAAPCAERFAPSGSAWGFLLPCGDVPSTREALQTRALEPPAPSHFPLETSGFQLTRAPSASRAQK